MCNLCCGSPVLSAVMRGVMHFLTEGNRREKVPMAEVLLEIKGLEKTFPGVRALKGVQLTVNKGEVHALMGENGAGKSTLIKVLTGIYQKNGGTIRFDGEEINARTTMEANEKGISTIYQELNLVLLDRKSVV